MIKWGRLAVAANGVSNVAYNANSGGPAFVQTFQVILTPYQSVGAAPTFNCLWTRALSGINFGVVCANATANTGVSYLVLGV